MKYSKIAILLLILSFLVTSGLGCKTVSKEVQEAMQPVKLTYWRVFDDRDAMAEIVADYQALHPNVTIEYKKLRFEEYEETLLNAMAEDRGPDIFSIHNTWVKKYQSKIAPMPSTVTLPYQYVSGTIKKETKAELKTTPTLSLLKLKQQFLDVVYNDAVVATTISGQKQDLVYGLPLSVDTLALFYNKDLLNNAGIPEPPVTWSEFQDHVKILTRTNERGDILQAGAALGTANNVERGADILSLLMMQNGAKMTDANGLAFFHQMPAELKGLDIPPGAGALNFYTNFANPVSSVYSWNEQMSNSLEAFAQGKVAYFFGYAYHLPVIRSLAPKLNFDISRFPQIGEAGSNTPEVNFANYWMETVSRKSKNQHWAWDFIQFATKEQEVKKYLTQAKKPTALKALINTQLEDLDLGFFAAQLLTARSWYRGANPGAVDGIFAEMINSVNSGAVEAQEAVNLAASKINQTIR
ncbi:MAG: extracellular solute-binding protein [Patescibacteria group bacterium]|nr:extracellular solute-binding protein [Patescibacteria group bacterium]MDD5490835.1 extracellular solute-binding protein [Patescibacteria group bacterium]